MRPEKLGEISLESARASVRRARSEVRDLLGPGHPSLDDVVQVVSELVANAVGHADWSRAGDPIGLTLTATADLIYVEVSDPGSAFSAPHISEERSSSEESGRGLLIVDRLCEGRWGTHEHARGQGRTVWCAVPRNERAPSVEETIRAQRSVAVSWP